MIQKIEEFVSLHGNQFHARVVSVLRKKFWITLVSPFYRDIATDKAREADIIAERDFPMVSIAGEYRGGAKVRLIAECKYISSPVVFWFDDKDMHRAEDLLVKKTALKPRVENINIEDHHWYSEKKVAKLFAAVGNGKQTENEIFFNAIDKVLNALMSYRSINSIVPKFIQRELVWPGKSPIYPIIICNDFKNLYKVPFDGSDDVESLSSQKFFQLEVNYSYTTFPNGFRIEHPQYFLIDVVNFNFLEDYIEDIIHKDINVIGRAESLKIKSL